MENVCLVALTALLSVLACAVVHIWQVRRTNRYVRDLRARVDELQERAMRADKDRLDAAVVKVLNAVDAKARGVVQALMSSRSWEIGPEPISPPRSRLSLPRLRSFADEDDSTTPAGRRPGSNPRPSLQSAPLFPELTDDEDPTPVSQTRIELHAPSPPGPPAAKPPGKPRR